MNGQSVEFADGLFLGLHERMGAGEVLGLPVGRSDVVLKGVLLNSPLPPAADLDGGEFLAAYERIDLGTGDVEHFSHISEGQETLFSGHEGKFATACICFRPFDREPVDLKGL